MTFDSAVSTDYITALQDLRDKVGGMASWSIKDDSLSGSDYFVLTTATGEDIRIVLNEQGYNEIGIEYGPDWDSANGNWNDEYGGTGNWSNYEGTISPLSAYETTVADTDAGTYWLEYVDGAGFVWYFQREQADGSDHDVAISFAEITKLWDYGSASNRESDYAVLMSGYDVEGNNHVSKFNRLGEADNDDSTIDGYGVVNPDANFSNYPYFENVMSSGQYKNSQNVDAVIGTHDLFLDERSGGDSAHRDTVQDSGGSDVYTILKNYGVNIAMRMD